MATTDGSTEQKKRAREAKANFSLSFFLLNVYSVDILRRQINNGMLCGGTRMRRTCRPSSRHNRHAFELLSRAMCAIPFASFALTHTHTRTHFFYVSHSHTRTHFHLHKVIILWRLLRLKCCARLRYQLITRRRMG